MTKAELIAALEPFHDDQYVYVSLHSERYPNGSQVAIQSVRTQAPWHDPAPDESNYLVGLVAHAQNSIVDEEERRLHRIKVEALKALLRSKGLDIT